jgi:large subunit ribosomal protein L30
VVATKRTPNPGRVRAEGASAGQAPAKRLKVTQIRSGIGFDRKQTLALRGLGLRRMRHTVEVPDTPESRGLILKVRHLVTVQE